MLVDKVTREKVNQKNYNKILAIVYLYINVKTSILKHIKDIKTHTKLALSK